MCAITLNEITRLVLEYPLAFVRPAENGPYVCVALFGVDPTENLYWRNGRWDAEYLPLNVARQPFAVSTADPVGAGRVGAVVACLDVENPGVQEATGERLFADDGKETPYLEYKLRLLNELVEGELQSGAFVTRLEELGLLRPIQLELKAPGIEPRKVTGLHSIDEQKLRELDAAALAGLNANGYLRAMHAMLLSLGHLQALARRSARSPARTQAPKPG